MTLVPFRPLVGLALLLALVSPAAAVESASVAKDIVVELDHAKIFRLPGPASTIVIGNPAIADATLQNAKTLIITGHAYGETNLVILDDNGETVSETRVSVSAPSDALVTVYKGAKRSSLSCMPDCQPTSVLGDDTTAFQDTLNQAKAMKQVMTSDTSSSGVTSSSSK